MDESRELNQDAPKETVASLGTGPAVGLAFAPAVEESWAPDAGYVVVEAEDDTGSWRAVGDGLLADDILALTDWLAAVAAGEPVGAWASTSGLLAFDVAADSGHGASVRVALSGPYCPPWGTAPYVVTIAATPRDLMAFARSIERVFPPPPPERDAAWDASDGVVPLDERVLLEVRRSLLSRFGSLFFALAIGLVAIVTGLGQLENPESGAYAAGMLMLGVLAILPTLLVTLIRLPKWLRDRVVVTDRRIIYYQGIYSPARPIEVSRQRILSVSSGATSLGRLLGFGDVVVQMSDEFGRAVGEVHFTAIERWEQFAQLIAPGPVNAESEARSA